MHAIYESHYLTDRDVANFARQSFATLADNFTEAQNDQLIRYLARGMTKEAWTNKIIEICEMPMLNQAEAHKLAVNLRNTPEHWVPFGHPQISIRMNAPVPIARQLFKHKIGFVESEESRRYISSKPTLFIPDSFRAAAANVKQGSGNEHSKSNHWLEYYMDSCNTAIVRYEHMIADGVCPEQARFILPQGCEVNWVWTGSLYAYAQMAVKRLDSHAQKETQQLAQQIDAIIRPLYPVSWPALVDGQY